MNADSATDTIERWIIVDLERILALPERLRRLWPPELLPRRGDDTPTVAEVGETDPGTASVGEGFSEGGRTFGVESGDAPSEGGGTSGEGGSMSGGGGDSGVGTKRELDVLTAWVRGFASELDHASTRFTIVVSSGVETVHLALCLGAGGSHAVVALQGEGLEGFAGHQLLRRIGPGQVGRVVEDLAELVERDCVLTLSWVQREGPAGLEFLHRRGGTWFRPVLDRRGDRVTVDADVPAGDTAVRKLLSAVLTRTLTTGSR